MSNGVPLERPPRVLFFGMQGNFSLPPLKALLEKGIHVCAVVIPVQWNSGDNQIAIRRKVPARMGHALLPLLHSPLHDTIIQLAEAQHIPVWEVARLSDPTTVETLQQYAPDMFCVACFSLYIPRVILDIPRYGCLNLHPSRLPANRGPDPLFWTLREGKHQTGVTVHCMDEGMDTGDIIAQTIIDIPDGMRYSQLEMQCAIQGGNLLAQAVWDIYTGLATSFPQEEAKSNYHPLPAHDDFVVQVNEWSARHVYNFVRGVATSVAPVILIVGNKTLYVRDATSYSHKFMTKGDEGLVEREDELWIRCKVGWVAVVQQ
ncbi:MAG TPA: methionyl-tRNA formyltransferase [Ktedonobacteraceae bacterium]|nr:methionyl-tRNA formyltransferase [Ktedonobacteraceae bacterium]